MQVTSPCEFCGVPIVIDLPDGYRDLPKMAHKDCEPTPGARGAQRIRDERRRQIEIEGFQPHDDQDYEHGELASAALAYLSKACNFDDGVRQWPRSWGWTWWKPSPDPIRNLEKAGALIAAEIDRLLDQGAGE